VTVEITAPTEVAHPDADVIHHHTTPRHRQDSIRTQGADR
jgi:hypothetical protein